MRLDPRTVVELLQRLERQHAEHRPHLADVTLAIAKGDFELAAESTGALHGVLESIIVTRTRLRDHVMSVDGLGEPGSLIELAIRGRRVVVAMQAERLRHAFIHPTAVRRARGWFTGKLHGGIAEVVRFLDEVIKSSAGWELYREGQSLPVGMKEADRATMYRTTVRIAQRTMRELGAEPDLVHFLRSGMAAAEWHDVQTGCKQIATALSGEIDVEADLGVVPQHPRPRTSSTNAGTP